MMLIAVGVHEPYVLAADRNEHRQMWRKSGLTDLGMSRTLIEFTKMTQQGLPSET